VLFVLWINPSSAKVASPVQRRKISREEYLKGELYTIKKPPGFPEGFNLKSATTYSPTIAVPSALAGLTSLFGMGRGGTLSL
jgi:hypothetical protein